MSKQKSEYAICVREIAKDKELEILRFIKDILKKRNIAQYELADRLDMSKASISLILSNKVEMSLSIFLQILEALDLSGVENHLQDNSCKTPIELLKDAEKEMLRHLENFIEYDHWEYIENINNTLISIKKLEELYSNTTKHKHKYVTQARYNQLIGNGLIEKDTLYNIVELCEVENEI